MVSLCLCLCVVNPHCSSILPDVVGSLFCPLTWVYLSLLLLFFLKDHKNPRLIKEPKIQWNEISPNNKGLSSFQKHGCLHSPAGWTTWVWDSALSMSYLNCWKQNSWIKSNSSETVHRPSVFRARFFQCEGKLEPIIISAWIWRGWLIRATWLKKQAMRMK